MLIVNKGADVWPTVAERTLTGRELRRATPRGGHAAWTPPPSRADPVQMLKDTDRQRVPSLVPLRYGRMRATPFTFLRGAAAVMAADLAGTPSSGLRVQACGDCHLLNFGVYASPEGTPMFDVNDFDETLPAPFEWDVKRLAASFAVAGRSAGLADKDGRALARDMVQAYRRHMIELVRLPPLEAWKSRIDLVEVLAGIEDHRLREREQKRLLGAVEAGRRGFPKLIERTHAGLRIRDNPPTVFSLRMLGDGGQEMAARTAFESYKATLEEDRHVLLDRYRLTDVAFKVVGIGSVGTFCALGLYATADDETLLLQVKEAQPSVLAPFAGSSVYANQGQRVVTGQRMMQAAPDVFLGWTRVPGDDQHCYVRRLKDSRMATIGVDIQENALAYHAVLCGRTLARAHTRSGDAASMAGYMGGGGTFDSAIADFAMAYADQTERDFRRFLDALKAGVIEARSG